MEVLSSRILLRPGDLDRSRRFYRGLLGLAVYREFGPPDDPGLVFFLGQGLLEVSSHTPGAPGSSVMIWIQVRDVHAEHARLAAARVPIVREPVSEPWGLTEMYIEDPDGTRIVLVEVPADHPLRRDPRPALPPGRRIACRITTRSTETRRSSTRPGHERKSLAYPSESFLDSSGVVRRHCPELARTACRMRGTASAAAQPGWRPSCGFEIGAVVRAHHEVHLRQNTPHRYHAFLARRNSTRRGSNERVAGKRLVNFRTRRIRENIIDLPASARAGTAVLCAQRRMSWMLARVTTHPGCFKLKFLTGAVWRQRKDAEGGWMPVPADLIERKETHFVLWRPSASDKPPRLVIGHFQPGNPPQLADEQSFPLEQDAQKKGLWSIAASDCGLESGHVYHYWFEVEDTNPQRQDVVPAKQVRCTDPAAYTVDWRLLAPPLPPPFTEDNRQPAAVIKFENDRLLAADPGGEAAAFPDDPGPDTLPANNRLVIYELPTAWSRTSGLGPGERGVGTFQDALALIDEAADGANFAGVHALRAGHSYLDALGINALELLPAQDSFFKRTWGYDTAHFLAPDFELGFPDGNSWPTANSDLAKLVESAHQHGIRFFIDVVMAFARQEAYQTIDFDDFYIEDPFRHQDDPDALTSGRGGDGHKEVRDGFSSTLLRYTRATGTPVYDPVSGNNMVLVPARGLMYSFITRWMRDFRVDGVRMDSVENVANWDFVGGFKDRARQLWQDRWQAAGLGAGADERFLVVGEELSEPMQLLTQNRLDGLWNDSFRQLVRAAILGESAPGEATFESTVRKAIDCRQLGFTDGAQAVNYITSHDVEGFRRERLFNMLVSSGLRDLDLQKRIELAFVCLLTAVGIPMLLAGEEFADQHDLFDAQGHVSETGGKQVDPVDFTRANEPWRKVILDYVARLVHFRTTQPALAVNDTEFLHIDFNDGKRVLAWKRGSPGQDPVVVVANFSDFATQNALGDPRAEYVVHNWPATPPGRHWREVTQDRDVRPDQVGREPIFSWEAKVYTTA